MAAGQVWLITGCSTGIGREIAEEALRRGNQVVVTARNADKVRDFVERYPQQARALPLDVTVPEQVAAAVAEVERVFGRFDVLVNNAGYGYLAAIEEGEEAEVRAMFETNFFGPLSMCRAALPLMRRQGDGLIINISSQAGLMSNPGTGYYSSSKFALEAMTEALSKEVAHFGIRVAAVEPGPFRTDFSGRSLKQTQTPLEAYADTVGARRKFVAQVDGTQPGDPVRAARAVVDLADMEKPPLHLLLGKVVLDGFRERLAGLQAEVDAWEEVTVGADFPPEEL